MFKVIFFFSFFFFWRENIMLDRRAITRLRGKTWDTLQITASIHLNITTWLCTVSFKCRPCFLSSIPWIQKRKYDLQFTEALSSHTVAISSHFSPRDSAFHRLACYSACVTEFVQPVPTRGNWSFWFWSYLPIVGDFCLFHLSLHLYLSVFFIL